MPEDGPAALLASAKLPKKGTERNLLLLLHGFGGRKQPFAQLGQCLKLPKTEILALNGPHTLPDELLDDPPGFSWYTLLDEEAVDFIKPVQGELRRLVSLQRSRQILSEAIDALVEKCAWQTDEIFLLGYGQGGTLALDLLLPPEGTGAKSWAGRLGGVVAVASEVLPERQWQLGDLARTPSTGGAVSDCGVEGTGVLLINGSRDALVPLSSAEASAGLLRKALADGKGSVQLKAFAKRGGEMLRGSNEEEMRVVMEFFADRLHGVGRRGSQEAMERLGAEPVAFAERLPADTVAELPRQQDDEDRGSGQAATENCGPRLSAEPATGSCSMTSFQLEQMD